MIGVVIAREIAAWWPVPGAESYKYTRGVVGIDAGSSQCPRAALLAISGAPGADPRMIRYLESAPRDLVMGRFPSVVLADGQVQAVVVGSGWGALVDAGPRLWKALEWRVSLVTDVDTLRLLPADLPVETLLIPHAGRLARLPGVKRGEIEADPVAVAILATGRFGATVLLKEVAQPVVPPNGSVRLALSGPARAVRVGFGNVLAETCDTLLTTGLPAGRTGLMAVGLQVLTASCFPGSYPPDVQAPRFPEAVWELLTPDQQ